MPTGLSPLIKLTAPLLFIALVGACSSAPAANDENSQTETAETADHREDAHVHDDDQDHDHQHDHEPTADHHGEDHSGHHDHRFDDPEEYAEQWNDPERDDWQQPEDILAAMAIEPGMTVADLGAGTGYFVPFLADAVGDEGTVVAIDIEASMLEYIENLAADHDLTNLETLQAGTDTTGLEPGQVDRILTVNTWHHFPDRPDYAAHLHERLADGGSLWVVDYQEDSPSGPPREHRLPPQVVVDELEAGGFDAEIHPLELPRQFVIVAHKQ